MTDSDSNAIAIDDAPGRRHGALDRLPAPAPDRRRCARREVDCVYDPDIDDTIPPFRPGPEPAAAHTHAWKVRWGLGLGGWALFVAVMYLTVGGHLNGYLSLAGLMVGFLVGLTGMGGGALMTPVLIFVFGFSADDGHRHRRHLRRRHQDRRLVEALAPGLGGHPPGALALPRQRPGRAHRRRRRHLRQEPLRRPRRRHPVPGHRLGADDGRRAAHREDRHPRRPEVPPREHQDVAPHEDRHRLPRHRASASSSASPRSAAAR